MKYAVHFLDPEQECAVMVSMALLLSTSDLAQIWPEVKPDLFDPEDVEVVVVPLHRIGAPAGKSGAEVFVVYLRSVKQESGSLPPSNALVMKLQKGTVKLAQEKTAAERWPEVGDGRFAKPIKLFSVRGYSVLVAPFRAAVKAAPDEHLLKFQILVDLYRTILDGDGVSGGKSQEESAFASVAKGVGSALKLVAQAHHWSARGDKVRRFAMQYSQKYEWYLRGTQRTNEAAATALTRLFGVSAEVAVFGINWPNPVGVVQRLLANYDQFEGAAGWVHGDLHPKNIIFDGLGETHIIDFGWAHADGHVVIDYVLLDINLRAMTLPSHIADAELLLGAQYLFPTDIFPEISNPIKQRLDTVKNQIWELALTEQAVSENTDKAWLHEYLIPYFLVTYGLLVFLNDAQNQRAMLASVLAASKRIHAELEKVGG